MTPRIGQRVIHHYEANGSEVAFHGTVKDRDGDRFIADVVYDTGETVYAEYGELAEER